MPFRFRSITFRIIVSSKFKSSSRSFLSSTRRRPKIPQGPVTEQTEAGRRNLARGAVEGVTEIVRFAPSACNTQPWLVEREGDALRVYRVRKPGRSGIMPAGQVAFYNQIDLGIFLCFLDLCLQRRHIRYEAKLHADPGSDGEKTLAAVYKWKQD